MHDKIKQILVVAATCGMIALNGLAASGILGGIETGAVSDKYPTFVTAADYAFSIWGLIYFGLIVFSIYQALPSNAAKFRRLRTVYILSCAANGAWLYIWSQEWILVSLAVISILLVSLAIINVRLKKTDSLAEFWFAKVPFGIYFGWTTAAAILNAAITLVYLNFQTSDSAAVVLAVILIVVAVALGVIIRINLANVFYPFAIAWALTAIAVKQSGKTAIVVACAFGVIILLVATISFLLEMDSSATKKEIRA